MPKILWGFQSLALQNPLLGGRAICHCCTVWFRSAPLTYIHRHVGLFLGLFNHVYFCNRVIRLPVLYEHKTLQLAPCSYKKIDRDVFILMGVERVEKSSC